MFTGCGTALVTPFRADQSLDEAGMLFANRTTWAHAVAAAAEVCGVDPRTWLKSEELSAVRGQTSPTVLR